MEKGFDNPHNYKGVNRESGGTTQGYEKVSDDSDTTMLLGVKDWGLTNSL
jgi:hypothetical protein